MSSKLLVEIANRAEHIGAISITIKYTEGMKWGVVTATLLDGKSICVACNTQTVEHPTVTKEMIEAGARAYREYSAPNWGAKDYNAHPNEELSKSARKLVGIILRAALDANAEIRRDI